MRIGNLAIDIYKKRQLKSMRAGIYIIFIYFALKMINSEINSPTALIHLIITIHFYRLDTIF